MRETPKELAARHGISINLFEHERKFGQLFPADNPTSPLMIRLMIIRDDLDFEFQGLALHDDDDLERVWRHTYFMRRISSSVDEARHVLRHHDFKAFVAAWRGTILPGKVDEIAAELEALNDLLGELRNGLGGHVRPKETAMGLQTHKDWTAKITRNRGSAYATTYRQFTQIATLFVWSEVVDQETFAAKHEALSKAIPQAVVTLLNGIDGLLQAFWSELDDARMEEF
jgi:hypothetical protein